MPIAVMPSSPRLTAIVNMLEYLNGMTEHEEFYATACDGVRYHLMKWRGQKCAHLHQEYTWAVYRESG